MAPALDEDEDEDKDIDYSGAVVSTFEHCCQHHVDHELILFFLLSHEIFASLELCYFFWSFMENSGILEKIW